MSSLPPAVSTVSPSGVNRTQAAFDGMGGSSFQSGMDQTRVSPEPTTAAKRSPFGENWSELQFVSPLESFGPFAIRAIVSMFQSSRRPAREAANSALSPGRIAK